LSMGLVREEDSRHVSEMKFILLNYNPREIITFIDLAECSTRPISLEIIEVEACDLYLYGTISTLKVCNWLKNKAV